MQRYEVFLKKPGREEFRHAGSLDAPDPEMAMLLARETHSRRGEGAEMWLVDREHVLVGDDRYLSVNDDKPHRHNDGSLVAARRKQDRESGGPGTEPRPVGFCDLTRGSLMTLSAGAREYLLSLADDEHMIGARHTSWIGLGPFLEEDLAFCSIAQDELGHAIALYELLLGDEQSDDLDAFAMLRDPGDYRSCHLAERECAAWNDSLVRHWLYDRAESIRWTALLESSDDRLAAVATRALRDETFHLAHAAQFMARITPDRPEQIIDSITTLLPIALGMWDPVQGEVDALADGITSSTSAELAEQWELAIRADLADWNLDIDWPSDRASTAILQSQDRRQRRSDGFADLQADLRKVIDLDPTARW